MITRPQYKWQLPSSIEARLGETSYGRQRTIFEDGQLLIILHDPPKPEDLKRSHKVFWRKPTGEILCNGQDNGGRQLKALLNSYEERLKVLETDYDEAMTAENYFTLIEQVMPLQRAATNIYATLQKAREQAVSDRVLIEARDRAYDLQRNFELLQADSKMALEFRIARNAEDQLAQSNLALKAQHRLNILAAITFPLLAIATIFGMNLSHGFESAPPLAFWCVFVGGLIVGLAVKGWVNSDR